MTHKHSKRAAANSAHSEPEAAAGRSSAAEAPKKEAGSSLPTTAGETAKRRRRLILIALGVGLAVAIVSASVGAYVASTRSTSAQLTASEIAANSTAPALPAALQWATERKTPQLANGLQGRPSNAIVQKSVAGQVLKNVITKYTLTRPNAVQVTLLSQGARVTSIVVQSVIGPIEVALGQYLTDFQYYFLSDRQNGVLYGAANGLICTAMLSDLDYNGMRYSYVKTRLNDGGFYEDGGADGLYLVNYELNYADDNGVVHFIHNGTIQPFRGKNLLLQADPGNYSIHVSYQLTEKNELLVTMEAQATIPMPIDLCSSVAFNLGRAGDRAQASAIYDGHLLFIPQSPRCQDANGYEGPLPPTTVESILAFTSFRYKDYDCTFSFDQTNSSGQMQLVARLTHNVTRLQLDIYTDQPALRLRTPEPGANASSRYGWAAASTLNGDVVMAGGALFWFQTQQKPLYDATGDSAAAKLMMGPSSTYRRQTKYAFSLLQN